MSRKKKDEVIRGLVRACMTIPDPVDILLCHHDPDEKFDMEKIHAHMEAHEARKHLAFAVGVLLNLKPGPGVKVVVDRKMYRVKIAHVSNDIRGTSQIVVIEPE